MEGDLATLLLSCLCYGAVNIVARHFGHRPLISASLAFWVGWSFLLAAAMWVEMIRGIPVGLGFVPFLERLFLGAFLGFMLILATREPSRDPKRYLEFVMRADRLFKRFGRVALAALFLVGAVFMLQRVAAVGLDVAYFAGAREIYMQRDGGVLQQIGSHLSIIASVITVYRGAIDAHSGINIRALLLVVLAGAPVGIANGGRMFLLSYLLAYMASFLLCRSVYAVNGRIMSAVELSKIAATVLVALLVFAVIGFVRGGYGEDLDVLMTVLTWPASTIYAMDDWISVALTSAADGFGANSLGWLGILMDRVGLIRLGAWSNEFADILYYFETRQITALVVPRSILPDIILDFGDQAIVPSMAMMAFVIEYIVSRNVAGGLFRQVVAAQMLLAAFMTIQQSVLSPGVAVAMIYAAIISVAVRIGDRK